LPVTRRYLLKVSLLGDGAVGKTSIRKNFLGKVFSTDYIKTLGADFAYFESNYGQYIIRWQIWDLVGQESFRNVMKSYYKGCRGALLVFDSTKPKTTENLKSWITDLQEHTGFEHKIPIILLGNKKDLKEKFVESSVVTTEMGNKIKENIDALDFLETSAKSGENIKHSFKLLGSEIVKNLK